jgi:hypothetical protein
VTLSVVEERSCVRSGPAADGGVPTAAVRAAAGGVDADELARALRDGIPSVFARVGADGVLFDMRTVAPDEVPVVADALAAALKGRTAR